MPKAKRPCPRGLYDGCPIPRELCTEDHEKTGQWHCLKFLREFERFVFGSGHEEEPLEEDAYVETEVTTLEELMRVLEGEDDDY